MKKDKQKNNNSRLAKPNAFIVAYALVAAAVVITLLGGLLVFVTSSQRRSSDEISRQQALQIAESGIYFYKWYLAHNLDGKNAQQIKDFWDSGVAYGVSAPYEQEVADKDGTPAGRYQIETIAPESNSTIVTVTSSGWTYRHPEIVRSIKVRFRRPSWSEYSVLANDFMRFGTGTSVFGPIHSNNGIRFDGFANNVITSSVEEYNDPDHSGGNEFGVHTHIAPIDPLPPAAVPNRTDVFAAGREFPVALIDFNGVTTDLSLIGDEAAAEGLFFSSGETYEEEVCGWRWVGWPFWWEYSCQTENVGVKGYHFTLRTDDKVEVRRVLSYGSSSYGIFDETDPEVLDIPANGLIYAEENVWVDGQIDGVQVTIAAADLESSAHEDIYINNDILYTNKDGQDVIGLIAEGDVSVGLYSEDYLEVDAALLAQNGRVGRNYYWGSDYVWREEIIVYGSIATNQRYGFAWTDGTGYNIRTLIFDNNLLYYPPPFFPTGTTYELDLWEDL